MTRIAIVEDHKPLRSSLSELVNSLPECECIGAYASGEEALKMLPGLGPDLVLMDIHLPLMSGIQCIAKLKAVIPNVRVLVLTVYEDGDKIFDALKAGASGYILKRSGYREIANAIGEMLEGGAPMTPVIALKVVESFRKTQTVVPPAPFPYLSNRETEVLELLAKGMFNKEIAKQLSVSIETIRWHLRHIYEKLHVNCRTEAAVKYLGRVSAGGSPDQEA